MHTAFQQNQHGSRQQTSPQQIDPSRIPYAQFPPPPPPLPAASLGSATVSPGYYNLPPPPPRKYGQGQAQGHAPSPAFPPPPPSAPPLAVHNIRQQQWHQHQQRQQGYYGAHPAPPPPIGQPAPYNPNAYHGYSSQDQQPLTSSTYIPTGDSFGPGVGIPPLHPTSLYRNASIRPTNNQTAPYQAANEFPASDGFSPQTAQAAADPRSSESQNTQSTAPSFTEEASTPTSVADNQLALEWPLERVVGWLSMNSFSLDWQETFKKLDLKGAQFFEIGRGHGGKGNFRMVYDIVFPTLAKQCTDSGTGWDQARAVEECRRLRKLIKGLRQDFASRQVDQPQTAAAADGRHDHSSMSAPAEEGALSSYGNRISPRSPDLPPPVRAASGRNYTFVRPKASGDFDKHIYHPTQASTSDPKTSKSYDVAEPTPSVDNTGRGPPKVNNSRDTVSPALPPEPSPRFGSMSHSRESSSHRISAYNGQRHPNSGTYPPPSQALGQRYYGHQRNQSSETSAPRSATEVARNWGDFETKTSQQESPRDASARIGSVGDPGYGTKEHRNILKNLFRRENGKKDDHPCPDEIQAQSPSSPVNFRLPSFSHTKSPAEHDFFAFLDEPRKFMFVTPDGWNYRLIDVTGVETSNHLYLVLARELSLPDIDGLSLYVTSPGQQAHDDAVLENNIQALLRRADPSGSLKLFLKTPYDVALPTGTQSTFPASAKIDAMPPNAATSATRNVDQATYNQLNGRLAHLNLSPVTDQAESRALYNNESFAAREVSNSDEATKYQVEVERKAKAYQASRQSLLPQPASKEYDSEKDSAIRGNRKVNFDGPRVSPFEGSFGETLEPRRKPPPVPPETTSTLIKANSLKKSADNASTSPSDEARSPPAQSAIDKVAARDTASRGRRRAIADSPSATSGIAGAIAGAGRLSGLIGAPGTKNSDTSSRSDSALSDDRESGKDSARAMASINFNGSLNGRNSPGSPRSPGFTMSKGKVPFKIPEYDDGPDGLEDQGRRVEESRLPNRLITKLKTEHHDAPDISPSTKQPMNKLLSRHSTRRGPQIDFKEEKVSFSRTPVASTPHSEDDDSDDGLFAVPIAKDISEPQTEIPSASRSVSPSSTLRGPSFTVRTQASNHDLRENFPTTAPAGGPLSGSTEELETTPLSEPTTIRRRPRPSNAERVAKAARRQSFLDDGWAPRPPPEALVERLDDFFPDINLDQPMLEGEQGNQKEEASDRCSSIKKDTAPTSGGGGDASRISDFSDKHISNMQSLAQRNVRKSGGLGRTKSIRDVVKGAYKQPASKPSSIINPRLSTLKGDVVRRRSTKMFGAKIEQIKVPRGSSLVKLDTIPQNAIPQDSIDVPQRQKTFKWVKGELIGKGSFGRVYLGMNTTTGELIAVKQVEVNPKTAGADKDKIKEMVKALDGEIDTMQHLDHGNIVQYLGCERKEYSISIFLEYISGGSIGSCLRKHGRFEESVVASLTRQTLCGINYLHEQGVLHRDLKADNILLDVDGTCKISDFGISKKTDNIYGNDATNSMQGSVFWMAPEVVGSHGQGYSAKVDIWSLGCVVLEMFAGKRPWSKEEVIGAIFKLGSLKQAPPIPEDVSSTISPVALSFMLDCFNVDPHDRPTADRLLKQPFCNVDPHFNFLDTELYNRIAKQLPAR